MLNGATSYVFAWGTYTSLAPASTLVQTYLTKFGGSNTYNVVSNPIINLDGYKFECKKISSNIFEYVFFRKINFSKIDKAKLYIESLKTSTVNILAEHLNVIQFTNNISLLKFSS